MKKEKELPVTPSESPQAANVPSNISLYFTEEVREKMAHMSLKEMEAVLKDMISTEYWTAILKYVSIRTPMLDATLRSTDPYKDPYKISWSHGALAGLSDIETYVIDLNSKSVDKEKDDGSVLMG